MTTRQFLLFFAALFLQLSAIAVAVGAFQVPSSTTTSPPRSTAGASSRKDFLSTATTAATTAGIVATVAGSWAFGVEPASARGRATLEKSYERYAPRIRAGAEFYGSDFRKLVEKQDWQGIKNALQDPPERKREDLVKPDAGVAARARQAGQLSEARVVVAADLFAAAFSDNSISAKTKKMKVAVDKLREAVEGMSTTAKIALGEQKVGGGLFGLGAKAPSQSELAKQLRDYYVAGGNAFNEYIYAANDDLALQFDRFAYVGN